MFSPHTHIHVGLVEPEKITVKMEHEHFHFIQQAMGNGAEGMNLQYEQCDGPKTKRFLGLATVPFQLHPDTADTDTEDWFRASFFLFHCCINFIPQ